MRVKRFLIGTAAAGLCLSGGAAHAAVVTGPVIDPANGHEYYLLAPDSWTASEAEAVTLGGHLATVRNEAENDFLFDTFADFGGTNRNLWIGLNDAASQGDFVWVSGEPVNFTKWSEGEPNNVMGAEDYVHIIANAFQAGTVNDVPRFWNDLRDAGGDLPEFDEQFGVVEVVPEPASAGLLALAGVALLIRRR